MMPGIWPTLLMGQAGPPMIVSANGATWFRPGGVGLYQAAASVSISGGTAPYTYEWTITGGDAEIVGADDGPNVSLTSATGMPSAAQCAVTDSGGQYGFATGMILSEGGL